MIVGVELVGGPDDGRIQSASVEHFSLECQFLRSPAGALYFAPLRRGAPLRGHFVSPARLLALLDDVPLSVPGRVIPLGSEDSAPGVDDGAAA